jgi:hypothetical protein
VPFLRYTRDRRGYETTYLMHGYRSAQGSGQTRVLYLFRSPAHVKVGRRAFDEEAREALEHTHPDLSFDWVALGREPAPHHFEEQRDRPGPAGRRPPVRPQPARESPTDASVLARVLGTAEAARLRTRYAELVQRIARRAQVPELRERLTGQVQRLNPDDWIDEAAVRAGVQTIEAAWSQIRHELPMRRRGGRRGDRPPALELSSVAGTAAAEDTSASRPSAIIEPREEDADARKDEGEVVRADRSAAAPADGDSVGRGADDLPGDRLPGGE